MCDATRSHQPDKCLRHPSPTVSDPSLSSRTLLHSAEFVGSVASRLPERLYASMPLCKILLHLFIRGLLSSRAAPCFWVLGTSTLADAGCCTFMETDKQGKRARATCGSWCISIQARFGSPLTNCHLRRPLPLGCRLHHSTGSIARRGLQARTTETRCVRGLSVR